MKQYLLLLCSLLFACITHAQTNQVDASRVIVRQSLYHKDRWLDSTRVDTAAAFASDAGSLLTPMAVDRWLRGGYVPNKLLSKCFIYVPNDAKGGATNTALYLYNRPPGDTLFPGTGYTTTSPQTAGGMLSINRFYYEKAGDNATQQYSAPLIVLSRTTNDTSSTYWDSSRVQPLQDVGVKAVYQLYPTKKQSLYTSPFGWTGTPNISVIGLGDVASYDITLKNANTSSGVSGTYAPTPWAGAYAEWDYNRGNAPNARARVIKGPVGTAGFFATCKSHQTGAISLGSGSSINRWVGFHAVGPLYMAPFGTASYTKDQILSASKIARVTAFEAGSMWRPYNETDSGYAFVSENKYDASYLNGALKLGGVLPYLPDTIYNLRVDGMATRQSKFDNQQTFSVAAHRYTGATDGSLTGAPTGTQRTSLTLTNSTVDLYMAYTNAGQAPYARMFLNGGQAGFQVYPTYDAGATQSGTNMSFYLQDTAVRINSSTTTLGIRSSKPFRWAQDATQMFGRRIANGDWVQVPLMTNSAGTKMLVNTGTDDGVGALQVSGTTSTDLLKLTPTTPPTSSADATGNTNEVRLGTDGALYLKTLSGWLKFSGATF